MATWTALLRKIDLTAGDTREVPTGHGQYHLRPLPNEDLHLFTKTIDNSRLVRQADPRATSECLSTIGMVSAVAIVLITTFAPRVAGLIAGYQVQAFKQEQQRLLNDGRTLEVEEAALLTTERLQHLAQEQQMVSPEPGQVFHLDDASAGAVAANRGTVRRTAATE